MRLLISLSTGLTLCIKFQKFPVNGDADGVVASTLSQFAKHVSEVSFRFIFYYFLIIYLLKYCFRCSWFNLALVSVSVIVYKYVVKKS